jgi:hypothetical protein
MGTQRMLISVFISGLVSFAVESAATADVAMISASRVSGSHAMDRDAPVRERFACIPRQILENPVPNAQDSRAYLDSARPDPGWNLPPGQLNMPNIFPLVRIPLGRTIRHPLTPNLDPPEANEENSQALELAGDPLHLQLTVPLLHDLC